MLAQGDLHADAPAIAAPTMVLCGSEDTVTPPSGNRSLAAAIANARYVELAGAGHASYIERSAAFNAAVREFLGAPGNVIAADNLTGPDSQFDRDRLLAEVAEPVCATAGEISRRPGWNMPAPRAPARGRDRR